MPVSSPRVPLTIAIDGPAAAGKSSVAKAVASRLGFTYVDTGAMYRALTLKALESGIAPHDGPSLGELAAQTELRFVPPPREGLPQEVWMDGRDRTRDIRNQTVDAAVSAVSSHPVVREWFKGIQRGLGRSGGVVMEGRDIGTVVLPNADVKLFLDGSFERRVSRRCLEFRHRGLGTDEDLVKGNLARRDHLDANRKTAPLKAAADAIYVDTTDKSLAEVVEEVVQLCLGRMGEAP